MLSSMTIRMKTEYSLLIVPSSDTGETFPYRLDLSAAPDPDLPPDEGWVPGADGRVHRTIQYDSRSKGFGNSKGYEVVLCSRKEPLEPPMIRREITKLGEKRMRARFFFRGTPKSNWLFFYVPESMGSIDVATLSPIHRGDRVNAVGIEYDLRSICNCGCGKRLSDQLDMDKGVKIEFDVALLPDAGFFYPRVGVWQGEGAKMNACVVGDRVVGSFGGVDYELSSPRRFRVHIMVAGVLYSYFLWRLPCDENGTIKSGEGK
jgi:hypothetical protein